MQKLEVPDHIAIIMDGNGRWAKRKGLPRIKGHFEGSKSVRRIVEVCVELNVKYLTLYAFSTENWKRRKSEVHALMRLLNRFLASELKNMMKNSIRFRVIGDVSLFPPDLRKNIISVESRTKSNSGLTLVLALNYGSRPEIVRAAREIAVECLKGDIQPQAIDEAVFQKHLYTDGIPDPDLLIRTSGEVRLSNFLLWQCSYTEFYFTGVLWPDFGKKELIEAITEYCDRERRYGKERA
ncbi:MAG: isoprenyl transferase [Candidatus Aureabacteria bacterium]|nr:isoprenyl transferase [Candidatus Auribacterota bacterium]